MISENLARFLRNLSLDPSLLEAFETEPQNILADTDLSAEEKCLLMSGDRARWRRELIPASEPPPGFI